MYKSGTELEILFFMKSSTSLSKFFLLMLDIQGKGLMTTYWLLGEEGSEESETLKEEDEEGEEVVEEANKEKCDLFEEEEEEGEEETCALVTYTVSDHDSERLMSNSLDRLDEEESLTTGKKIPTKETSLEKDEDKSWRV